MSYRDICVISALNESKLNKRRTNLVPLDVATKAKAVPCMTIFIISTYIKKEIYLAAIVKGHLKVDLSPSNVKEFSEQIA